MLYLTFKVKDKGFAGDALELTCKALLNRPNAGYISAMGRPDFQLNRKHYECKQNGGVMTYNDHDRAFYGSRRIIYATHIVYHITDEFIDADGDTCITLWVDIPATQLYVLDRGEFVKYLETTKGMTKPCSKRGTVNIQSLWNYTSNAWIGKKGRDLERWAYDHEIDDDIIDRILEAWYEKEGR